MGIRLWLDSPPSSLAAAFVQVHEVLDNWPLRGGDWEELAGVFREQRKQGGVLNYRRAHPARTNHDRAIVGSGPSGLRLRRLVPLRCDDALQLRSASAFQAGQVRGRVSLAVPPEICAWEAHEARRAQTGDARIELYVPPISDSAAAEARADVVVALLRYLTASLATSAVAVTVGQGDDVLRWAPPAALEPFLESVWVAEAGAPP